MSGPTVCLTFDFDGLSIWLRMFDNPSATALSRGEFGPRVGTPRLLDLLAREKVPGTFFTPGHTVDSFPEVCERIVAEGHEMGNHGYFHLDPCAIDDDTAREELERGNEAIERRLGVRPTGYRAPGGNASQRTIELVAELGFAYDSSLMAQDTVPYYVRLGDVAHLDRPYEFGHEIDLVEMPTMVSLIDVPQMEFLMKPLLPGLHANEKVLAMWRDELDWIAEREAEGVFILVLHPSTIPRGARLGVLEALIAYAKERGAVFKRLDEAARDWRALHPLGGAT